jgi:rhomboid protease GluP
MEILIPKSSALLGIWKILISVAPLLIGLPIAWYAHFIGLAVGFIYGLIRR